MWSQRAFRDEIRRVTKQGDVKKSLEMKYGVIKQCGVKRV